MFDNLCKRWPRESQQCINRLKNKQTSYRVLSTVLIKVLYERCGSWPQKCYVSVKSKLQHAPPPPGIPRAFDTFAVPGGRAFDYQSLPGGGEFDPHALGVGNLNSTLACENIRSSSLFAAGDVSRGGTSATQRQKFHTDDAKSVRNLVRSADWSTE